MTAGREKEGGLATTVTSAGRRGVICELLLNFTVDTTHRLCSYTVKSGKPSFDQLINLVIYVCIYRCSYYAG